MLRAFVEVDRATMGPERLAAKISAYERLYRHVPRLSADPGPAPSYRWRNGGVGIPCSRGTVRP